MSATYVVMIANSVAYGLGTFLSYALQVRFVHEGARFSRRGIMLFFIGQLILSLGLGLISATLEAMFMRYAWGYALFAQMLALICALLVAAPVSFLLGRYCTRVG